VLTLYQVEWCPYCHRVRQLLTEHGLTYTTVNVPARREERAELVAVSGQDTVPVLVDGERVVVGSDAALAHIRATYPPADDAADHAAIGRWRWARPLALAPRAAAARVRTLLEEKGFVVVAQAKGPKLSPRLSRDHLLLHVAVPAAAAKAVGTDPTLAAALTVPVAVSPRDGGGSLVAAADPVALVWVNGDPALLKLAAQVKERLAEALAPL
jgi:glutaredoxin